MDERIKKIRKALDLTQQEFANRIGVKRNTVATYEMGRSAPSDSAISLICREFNVSEEWLRTGKGEMFITASNNELDLLAKKYDLSDGARILIEKFLHLKKEQQDVIINFVREAAAGLSAVNPPEEYSVTQDPSGFIFSVSRAKKQDRSLPDTGSSKLNIDAEVEAFRRSLEQQEKAEAGLSASNGQNDIGIEDTDERKLS